MNVEKEDQNLSILVKALEQTKDRKELNEEVETCLIQAIAVYGNAGKTNEIAELLGMKNLPEKVNEAIEPALLKGLDNYGTGYANRAAELVKRDKLPDSVRIKAIKICGDIGWLTDIASLLDKKDLTTEVKKSIEPALLKGLELMEHAEWIGEVKSLIQRKDLSDQVMITAIQIFGEKGEIDELVKLFDRKELTTTVKAAIEPALIKAIEVCAEKGQIEKIANPDLLLRKDLSIKVKEAIEFGLLKGITRSEIKQMADLFDEKGLVPISIRKAIEPNIIEKIKKTGNEGKMDEISYLVDLVDRKVASRKVKSVIESALVKGIERFVAEDFDGIPRYGFPSSDDRDDYIQELKKERSWMLQKVLERKDLSADVLIKAIEACELDDEVKLLINLDQGNFSKKVKSSMDAPIIKEIKMWGEKGRVDWIANLVDKTNLSKSVQKAIESILLKGIEKSEENKWIEDIVLLLSKNNLSDDVRIRAIRVCEKAGEISTIADFINRTDNSENVKNIAEAALIRAIEATGKQGRIPAIIELLEKDYLSEKIKGMIELSLIKGLEVYGKNYCETFVPYGGFSCDGQREYYIDECNAKRPKVLADLLKRNDISEAVKRKVMEVIEKNKISIS